MVTDFILKEIPVLNPYSYEYVDFWKDQKRAIIEGVWSGGKWMPPQAYYYANIHKIKVNRKGYKQQIVARPTLRDVDWEKCYLFIEARGFSGFADDAEFSSNDILNSSDIERDIRELSINPDNKKILDSLYKPDGSFKTFVPARDYISKVHKTSLGKALYFNNNKNIIDFEGRGIGKTYLAAGIGNQNFITDGATDYDEYLLRRDKEEPLSAETVVGAIDAKWSANLLRAFDLGLREFPGGMTYGGEYFPPPLLPYYSGTTTKPGDFIEASYKQKVGNDWKIKGSFSKIHHRTFHDNPLAANGLSPNLVFLEEIGFFYNLKASLGAIRDTIERGGVSTGTVWMFGTGGENESGSIDDAEDIFLNPEEHNCLAFEDKWEGRKKKIGYFVPAFKKYNDIRDANGNLDETIAKERYLRERKEEEKSKDKAKLMRFLANNPIIPSEVFIVAEGGYFPVEYLKEHRAEVFTNPEKYYEKAHRGSFDYDEDKQEFVFRINPEAEAYRDYPVRDKKPGCVEIYEYPIKDGTGKIEAFRYFAGSDQKHLDDATTSSINSFYIMDRITRRIVCEYTGKPMRNQIFYEQMRRALLFYNGTLMYERSTTNVYQYFETMRCLHLLADTPYDLRDPGTFKEHTDTSKGFPTSPPAIKRALDAAYEILMEPLNDNTGRLVLHTIKSPGLITELIKYTHDGNFDRVSAFRTLCYYVKTYDKYTEVPVEQSSQTPVKKSSYYQKFKRKKRITIDEHSS